MKKGFLLLLAVGMLLGMLGIGVAAADNHYDNSYSAPYGTPAIDGIGNDDVWKLAWWETLSVNTASNKLSVRFKVAHDDNLIYFLVEATDPLPSSQLKETLWFQLHSHTCSDPASCTTFTHHLMTFAGTIYDQKAGANISNTNYKVTKAKSGTGTICTLEWSFDPAEAIPTDSTTAFGLDFLADDYTADNVWIDDPQTWNAYSWRDLSTANNFGALYFLTQAETDTLGTSDFYNDVPLSHEAYEAIRYTSESGIFVQASASNPSFYPENKLSRAQFVTILGRLAGADVSSYSTTAFTDVDFARDAWYAKYAEWARVNGIVVGNQFMANKEITVAEAVVMLQRYADNIEGCYMSVATPMDTYGDSATIPAWAEEAMQWAVYSKLYPFSGSSLTPTRVMTRAMAAMLIYNYDTTVFGVGADGNPNIVYKEPPAGIDWDKEASINALEFGFVNDGVTPNDGIMAYYLEHYAATVPLEFPKGTYVFAYQIDFPQNIYIELSPKAEWLLVSDTVQDYFITVQLGREWWGGMEDYAQQSYIRGGKINANFNAKVGIGLHGGMHTAFEDFKLYNVLEKGIVTEINDLNNGCYRFENIYLYNERAIEGTVAIYDNEPDNTYVDCQAVNFEKFIYTTGGSSFTRCTAWFNTLGKSLIKNSVFAHVVGGSQSVFTRPVIDTYRTGFLLEQSATGGMPAVAITELIWVTNSTFYSDGTDPEHPEDNMQAEYPMCIFQMQNDNCRVFVTGMWIPWLNGLKKFSNIALPSSSFIQVRYDVGWNPWNQLANFRNDT